MLAGLKNIIVNADDFGLKSSVNMAIIESFKNNLINSTTIMANMPGYEEAISLAHDHQLVNKIGAHLVLTEGVPLTDDIKTLDYLYKLDTDSKRYLFRRLVILDNATEKLILNEFAAQIDKIKDSGIPLTHLDTHHHMHQYFGITRILLKLKKIYKIPYIRILNNTEEPSARKKKIYRGLVNLYLRKNHANYSDFFGNQTDIVKTIGSRPELMNGKKIEIMVHPDYDRDGKLIDKSGADRLDFSFLNALKEQ